MHPKLFQIWFSTTAAVVVLGLTPAHAGPESSTSTVNAAGSRQQELSERGYEIKDLRTKLKSGNLEERMAEIEAIHVRQATRLEQLQKMAEQATPGPKIDRATRIAMINESAPSEMKAALIERIQLAEDLADLKKRTKTLDSNQRSAAMAQWFEQNAGRFEEMREKMLAGALATARGQQSSHGNRESPPLSEDMPAELKARIESRRQMSAEFRNLKEQTQNASPEERSRAFQEWMAENRSRMTPPPPKGDSKK